MKPFPTVRGLVSALVAPVVVGLVSAAATSALAGVEAAAQDETLALVGGMLLDGYEAPAIHHAAIVIEGDRIVAVGPASAVDIPAGARVIDTSGMTMLPGLIDLHVHLMILGHGEYTEWFPIFEDRMEEMMAISAKQLLMAGVTTAVDLGGPLEVLNVRDRIDGGEIPAHGQQRGGGRSADARRGDPGTELARQRSVDHTTSVERVTRPFPAHGQQLGGGRSADAGTGSRWRERHQDMDGPYRRGHSGSGRSSARERNPGA